jgi:hypothetical protein
LLLHRVDLDITLIDRMKRVFAAESKSGGRDLVTFDTIWLLTNATVVDDSQVCISEIEREADSSRVREDGKQFSKPEHYEDINILTQEAEE